MLVISCEHVGNTAKRIRTSVVRRRHWARIGHTMQDEHDVYTMSTTDYETYTGDCGCMELAFIVYLAFFAIFGAMTGYIVYRLIA